MRTSRALVLIVLFVVAVGAAWWFTHRAASVGETVTVYYTKPDGTTLVPWRVSLGPARDPQSVAFYAATQCVAGPPPDTQAVRFPPGTRVRSVDVHGTTADVDLSHDVAGASQEGSFAEAAEFKALVWTLTQPSLHTTTVEVRIDGARVATLPGGHLELDELSRSSF